MSMDELRGRDQPRNRDYCNWPGYEYYVLNALKSLEGAVNALREDISLIENSQTTMKENLAGLNVKAGLWGAVAGAVTIFGWMLYNGHH